MNVFRHRGRASATWQNGGENSEICIDISSDLRSVPDVIALTVAVHRPSSNAHLVQVNAYKYKCKCITAWLRTLETSNSFDVRRLSTCLGPVKEISTSWRNQPPTLLHVNVIENLQINIQTYDWGIIWVRSGLEPSLTCIDILIYLYSITTHEIINQQVARVLLLMGTGKRQSAAVRFESVQHPSKGENGLCLWSHQRNDVGWSGVKSTRKKNNNTFGMSQSAAK